MLIRLHNRVKCLLCISSYRQHCALPQTLSASSESFTTTHHERYNGNSSIQSCVRTFNSRVASLRTTPKTTGAYDPIIVRSEPSFRTNDDVFFKTTPSQFDSQVTGSRYLEQASVYVHWPYCKQLCSYCSFVKYVPRAGTPWTLDDDVMETAMVQELQTVLKASHVRRVTSIFFGGGTPSLARPQLVQRILEGVAAVCSVAPDAEVSLEGNPSSLTPHKMADFVAAGVNRLSIGVQTMDQSALTSLRRDHSSTEAVRCVEAARRLLPGRVSLDMLFARPGQTLQQWREELDAALHFSDDHIALYQLTLEPGTPLYRHVQAGIVQMPCADTQADMYEHAVSSLTGSREFTRYEVANFSRSPASQSHHNKNYWQAGQYVGIGPGAHSRIVPLSVDAACWGGKGRREDLLGAEGVAGPEHQYSKGEQSEMTNTMGYEDGSNTACGTKEISGKLEEQFGKHCPRNDLVVREERINAPDPARWMSEIKKKGNGVAKFVEQRRVDVLGEYLATGLRTVEGVGRRRWQQIDPDAAFVDVFNQASIGHFIKEGLLSLSDNSLRPTEKGMNVVDSILPDLFNLLKFRCK